jgi:hypothetical protein
MKHSLKYVNVILSQLNLAPRPNGIADTGNVAGGWAAFYDEVHNLQAVPNFFRMDKSTTINGRGK